MAMKFLNKKGWHTGSLRNVERVWVAEQKEKEEQRKIEEYRKQIKEEKDKAEYRALQEKAGLKPAQERLDFLYESGLAVGKGSSEGFQALQPSAPTGAASSSAQASAASSSKAAALGALFEDKPQSANDAWRKLHSDPLLLIRQREQDAIARIKNNPIKMAEIKKSVEAEKKQKEEKKEKRKHKKHRNQKSKSKRHHSNENSDSEEISLYPSIIHINGMSILKPFPQGCTSSWPFVMRCEASLSRDHGYSDARPRHSQVSEASVNRNRSTIIVPAGSSGEEGWEAFRNVLLEINNEASRLYVIPNHPNEQHMEPPEHLPGLSDDVGAGFIAGHGSQSASGPEVDVERLVDLPPQEEISGMGMSKVIRADQKRFFFDLGSNNRGHYLRISEVAGADRSSIILPLSGLKRFHEMVGHFVDIMKDRLEGMTGVNVRTVEPSQRC